MAMARPCVSTTLGAEGIEAAPGRDLLLADAPDAFADAVLRLLAEPGLAGELGRAGRRLAEERYSWRAASERLVGLFRAAIEDRLRRAA
jgi:glycosyltransferase involved in cell wall biosynthesis